MKHSKKEIVFERSGPELTLLIVLIISDNRMTYFGIKPELIAMALHQVTPNDGRAVKHLQEQADGDTKKGNENRWAIQYQRPPGRLKRWT